MKYVIKKMLIIFLVVCNVCACFSFLFNGTINDLTVSDTHYSVSDIYTQKAVGAFSLKNLNYDFDYYEEMGDKLFIDNLEKTASQKSNKQLT